MKIVPLYEYECEKCGERIEVIQKFSDPHRTRCPKCRGRLKRLLSAPGLHFKGPGWYVTDYARGDSSAAGSSGSNGASGSAEGKPGEAGAESKEAGEKPAAAPPAARPRKSPPRRRVPRHRR